MTSSEDLANDVEAKKPGDTVTIGLLRANGKGGYEHKTVSVTLGSQPNSVPNPNTPEGLSASPRVGVVARSGRYRWGMSETAQRANDLSPRVKICGITDLHDAELAAAAGRVGDRDGLL